MLSFWKCGAQFLIRTEYGTYRNALQKSQLIRASAATFRFCHVEFTGVPNSRSANFLEFRHGALTAIERGWSLWIDARFHTSKAVSKNWKIKKSFSIRTTNSGNLKVCIKRRRNQLIQINRHQLRKRRQCAKSQDATLGKQTHPARKIFKRWRSCRCETSIKSIEVHFG